MNDKHYDRKKEIIKTSHLSSEDKEHLTTLLDQLWTKALNHEYVNHSDNPNGQIGMFGTGFYSFMNKTTKKCSEDFIKMCVDILALNDDEEIFNRAETVLTKDFHGMKSAAASVVLHCLKPGTFPILNTNMGADNIFEALGIKLRKKADIDTYINNCRLIKKYRDKNNPPTIGCFTLLHSYNKVNCVDISKNGELIACGYNIIFFNKNNKT